MNQFFDQEDMQRMGRVLLVLAVVVALYFGMKFINQVKTFNTIGLAPSSVNTIDVTGEGVAYALPTIATESFSVQDTESTVASAQVVVNKNVAAALSFLKTAGVEEKDITTTDYSASPQYSNPCAGATACPINASNGQPQITGYIVSQSVSIKIRDAGSIGKIVSGLGAAGATGLNGPSYSVDDPTAVQDQARTSAINAAEAKAKTLAGELGVHLVRITNYTESTGGNGGTSPMTYSAMSATAAPAAQLPSGENKYTSDVTITYEIR